METSLWVALIGAGGTVLAAAATAILTHVLKPKSEPPADAASSPNRPGQKKNRERSATARSPLVTVFLLLFGAVGVLVFLCAGGGLLIYWKADLGEHEYKERMAKQKQEDEAARLVLSCDEKPVIKIKKGSTEDIGVPAITIKIERIECRGDVELWFETAYQLYPYGLLNYKLTVPDGQTVVTWNHPAIPGNGPHPKVGTYVIRVQGTCRRGDLLRPAVKAGVDVRVEVIEEVGK
jgi:hypothetical protein